MKSASEILKEKFVATRISFRWWGQRRQCEKRVREKMADAIDADAGSIGANKKLYSGDIDAIKEINSLRTNIKDWWESQTIPYGEDGVRLLPRDRAADFDAEMRNLQYSLAQHARDVDSCRDDILADASRRLGDGFNANNYPIDLSTLFGVEWSFPDLKPADGLPPQVLEAQKALFAAKLQEAVELIHNAFMAEFKELVEHLHDRLTMENDGKKKVFRDSAVKNLQEFFTRFKELNPGDCQALENLVNQGEELLCGIDPEELRKGKLLREEIRIGLSNINEALAPLVVAKPRRNIVTPNTKTSVGVAV